MIQEKNKKLFVKTAMLLLGKNTSAKLLRQGGARNLTRGAEKKRFIILYNLDFIWRFLNAER